jgi:hypothetical protein
MSTSAIALRLAEPIVDPRTVLGRDFGSEAKVLAISGLVRLVWAKPTHTMLHIPGMVRAEQGATLELRVFKRTSDGSVQFHYTIELSVGGRLSRARVLAHQRVVDTYLGSGATAQLDSKSTVVFGVDLVGEFMELLAPQVRRELPRQRETRRMGATTRDSIAGSRRRRTRGDHSRPPLRREPAQGERDRPTV